MDRPGSSPAPGDALKPMGTHEGTPPGRKNDGPGERRDGIASTRLLNLKTTDRLLKAMLVLSRTVDHLVEERAIDVAEQPLSKSKAQILRLLGKRGEQNSTQIARYLGVSKPAVTQIVESLIANTMVQRLPSEHDRRGFNLKLTAKGRKIYLQIQAHQRHLVRSATRLHPGEADLWAGLLQEMSRALVQADRNFKQFCFQCGAHADGTCVLVGGNADCPFLKQRQGTVRKSRKPQENRYSPARD